MSDLTYSLNCGKYRTVDLGDDPITVTTIVENGVVKNIVRFSHNDLRFAFRTTGNVFASVYTTDRGAE